MKFFCSKSMTAFFALWLIAALCRSDAHATFIKRGLATGNEIDDYVTAMPDAQAILSEQAATTFDAAGKIQFGTDFLRTGFNVNNDHPLESGNNGYSNFNASGRLSRNSVRSHSFGANAPLPGYFNLGDVFATDIAVNLFREIRSDIDAGQGIIAAWSATVPWDRSAIAPSMEHDFPQSGNILSDYAISDSPLWKRAVIWILTALGPYAPFKLLAITFFIFAGFDAIIGAIRKKA